MLVPQRVALERPFTSDGGHAFIARIPEEIQERIERGAETYVTEDGIRLSSPNTNHDIIREAGAGTYSLWNGHAYFSALDSSNCQKNGRSYEIVWLDWPGWYELTDQDAVSPTRSRSHAPSSTHMRRGTRPARGFRLSQRCGLLDAA